MKLYKNLNQQALHHILQEAICLSTFLEFYWDTVFKCKVLQHAFSERASEGIKITLFSFAKMKTRILISYFIFISHLIGVLSNAFPSGYEFRVMPMKYGNRIHVFK